MNIIEVALVTSVVGYVHEEGYRLYSVKFNAHGDVRVIGIIASSELAAWRDGLKEIDRGRRDGWL